MSRLFPPIPFYSANIKEIHDPPWNETVTSGKHRFHTIIVVTGSDSTNGSPTRDIWQKDWGDSVCLARAGASSATDSPVWSDCLCPESAHHKAKPHIWPPCRPLTAPRLLSMWRLITEMMSLAVGERCRSVPVGCRAGSLGVSVHPACRLISHNGSGLGS